MIITPEHILIGLSSIGRQNLANLLAFYQESNPLKILSDSAQDWRKQNRMESSKNKDSINQEKVRKHFEQRLAKTGQKIYYSSETTEEMRLRLWMNLREGLGLPPAITFAQRGINHITADIGSRACKIFSKMMDDEKMQKTSLLSGEYWRKHANRRLNPFADDKIPEINFHTMVTEMAYRVLDRVSRNGDLSPEQRENILDNIRKKINQLDPKSRQAILDGFGIKKLNQNNMWLLLTGGGVLTGLGVSVELAGFSAYILAAQASAIIPLVSGKTLVCILAVIADPLFIFAAIFGSGALVSQGFKKQMMELFSITVTTILALHAIAAKKTCAEPMLYIFRELPSFLKKENAWTSSHINSVEMSQSSWRNIWQYFRPGFISTVNYIQQGFSPQKYPKTQEYLQLYSALRGV